MWQWYCGDGDSVRIGGEACPGGGGCGGDCVVYGGGCSGGGDGGCCVGNVGCGGRISCGGSSGCGGGGDGGRQYWSVAEQYLPKAVVSDHVCQIDLSQKGK